VKKQVHEGLKQGPNGYATVKFFYERGEDFDNTDLSLVYMYCKQKVK